MKTIEIPTVFLVNKILIYNIYNIYNNSDFLMVIVTTQNFYLSVTLPIMNLSSNSEM
jgi:hypothetical protein